MTQRAASLPFNNARVSHAYRNPVVNHYVNYQIPSVTVVVPAMNEADNLPHVLPLIPRWVHEVILVDGHSVDGTVEVAKRLLPDIRIVTQQKRGKGEALRCGFDAAEGDIIVMIDADGSMDPRELPAFIGELMAGADMVKGSRFVQGGGTDDMSLLRQLGNRELTFLAKVLYGGNFTDLCYGYIAFWKRILPQLKLDGMGFEIEAMMNVRAMINKFRVAEVPSFEYPRICGESNLQTFPDGWRVLKTIIRERFQAKR